MNKLLILFLLTLWVSMAQGQIQYSNKSFLKEIELWSKGAGLESITHPDSQLKGRFFRIDNNGLKKGYAYVGRVYSCSSNGCRVNSANSGSTEYFDYFAIFDNAYKVCRISIFNYQATHGQEVTARSWLKQFLGYDGSKRLDVGKNVDAISGATKSAYSFTEDIQQVLTALKKL